MIFFYYHDPYFICYHNNTVIMAKVSCLLLVMYNDAKARERERQDRRRNSKDVVKVSYTVKATCSTNTCPPLPTGAIFGDSYEATVKMHGLDDASSQEPCRGLYESLRKCMDNKSSTSSCSLILNTAVACKNNASHKS